MNLGEEQCWARLAGASHGVLGTLHPRRGVDAVPAVFVLAGAAIVIPVDRVKPKRSTRLQRQANLEHDERCVLLVEHYDDDWTQLWWVRVHGRAAVGEPSEDALYRLGRRFPAYRAPGAVAATITLVPTAVSGWAAGWQKPPPD